MMGIGALLLLGIVSGASGSASRPPTAALTTLTPSAGSLMITQFSFSPSSLSVDTETQGTISLSGGTAPFDLWLNNSAPGCGPPTNPYVTSNTTTMFHCSPTSTGMYTVHLDVLDSATPTDKASQSTTLTVNSNNGNGNGGGSGNNSNNNNSGNNSGFNLSSLGPLLDYGLIGAIVVLALLVTIAVGVIWTGVGVRRLSRQPKGGVVCPSCHEMAPAGSKFCPNCAASLTPTQKGK
ncbi:MAG: zinc ribbon domain-containing protein [Thermoplasmata archaeon]